ncbi:MoaD/ThiS family protein [Draconibacterium halophilum]|uniref:MoaD/ThiS family protein n=1 Tax=Draconibacterium halophilum TaxID=2706887 RepID=A0A6C0RDE3_9BACT|nr:MoaD/ThiS family protein [Draconibacterium halophilum]QIA07936.1 MoaD/ThiS family protein [Draconibacterium halophilum]
MNRKIVCFAGLKKFFGDETSIEMAPEESYANLLEKLGELNPEAKEVLTSCRIAVNEKFVPLNETINDQTTLFLIPPSSGG